jgi:acyl carrier protein
MTKEKIVETINLFLKETLEVEESLIQPMSSLKEDIGLTSLDAVEISIFIKRTFGFQPERGDMQFIRTLDDLYNYVETHQQ